MQLTDHHVNSQPDYTEVRRCDSGLLCGSVYFIKFKQNRFTFNFVLVYQ